jgi:DNA-binding YbaB/EbfC family protein
MIDKMKQLYDMQKKAKQIQKELKETEIEAQSADGGVTVIFNGEIHIVDVKISEAMLEAGNKHALEQAVKNTVAQAISKAQAIAAEKAKSMMGDLGINLPGM